MAKAFQQGYLIEVIGGIKEEPTFVKLEVPVDSIEITADDILSSAEDGISENETKPYTDYQIPEINSMKALEDEISCKEDQESNGSHGNIDYNDKFYMESNLGEGETLVLNDPQAVQIDIPRIKNSPNRSKTIDASTSASKTNETTDCREKRKRIYALKQPNRVKPTEYKVIEKGQLQCIHCEFIVTGQNRTQQITQHILSKHREDMQLFQCPHCPYKSPWHIGSHILFKHTSENDIQWFKCDKCDKKYKAKTALRKHLVTHYNNGDMRALELLEKYKCTICGKGFKFADRLTRHIRGVHKKERLKHYCNFCDFTANGSNLLKTHIQVKHTDSKNLKIHRCEKCNNYETKFEHRLKAHITKIHSTDPKICEICGHKTLSMPAMKLHQLTHKKQIDEKELKYRCKKCDYKTYRLYSFNVHKLNHLKPNQIKYFNCYHCDFKAKRKDNLKTHVLRHFKKEEVDLECYLCEFSTNNRKLLTTHLGVKHEKGLQKQHIPNPNNVSIKHEKEIENQLVTDILNIKQEEEIEEQLIPELKIIK